jgi:DNA polymerase delta subunit 1
VFKELLGVGESGGGVGVVRGDTIEFMVTSWHSQDEEDFEEGDDDEEEASISKAKYVIRAFGVNREGRSVCLRVDGFTPYFYVKAPATAPHVSSVTALTKVESFLKERFKSTCIGVQRMRKKDFWGFTNGELYDFFRLKFRSLAAMRKAASSLGFPVAIGGAQTVLKIYESNIDPLLRFMHIRDLRSVGWLKTKRFSLLGKESSPCDVAARCEWLTVDPAPEMEQYQAPLLVAGFDIECNSAHGDFPVAKKDYRRLAIDIESAYERCGIKALDSEEAKKRLHACLFLAFSLDEEIEGGKIK